MQFSRRKSQPTTLVNGFTLLFKFTCKFRLLNFMSCTKFSLSRMCIPNIQYVKIVRRTSVEKHWKLFFFFGQKAVLKIYHGVWIIFRLSFKTFFWRYMLSFYCPFRSFEVTIFLKNINIICNFGGWSQNYLNMPKAFWTNMLYSFRPTVQFSRKICSTPYSIVPSRCLWSLFLTFTMFMKL